MALGDRQTVVMYPYHVEAENHFTKMQVTAAFEKEDLEALRDDLVAMIGPGDGFIPDPDWT